jgi:hypothetical protein
MANTETKHMSTCNIIHFSCDGDGRYAHYPGHAHQEPVRDCPFLPAGNRRRDRRRGRKSVGAVAFRLNNRATTTSTITNDE